MKEANNSKLFQPLALPNGAILPNRLCKAAMEENLSDEGQIPGNRLYTLYSKWSKGGAGLILTGNVMVSADALTGPGGVVLDKQADIEPFENWAKSGLSENGHLWMQINHPGRQVYAAMGEQAVAPSDIGVDIPGFSTLFAKPRELNSDEIKTIISQFTTTAILAEKAGFTGVQIHAAHGYLISQFLSPLTNKRNDEWGGSLENRAKILFEVIKSIRNSVAKDFCLSVKLNSADFQKGGFELEDARWVITQLNELDVDLVELSGGSYESPAMQGNPKEETETKGSSYQREAYFVEFAEQLTSSAKMPLMVTGGITKLKVAESAISSDDQSSIEVLGIARAMAYNPNLVNDWVDSKNTEILIPQTNWKNKILSSLASMAVTKAQLDRMAKGKDPKASMSPVFALLLDRLKIKIRTKRYRKWRSNQ